MGDFSEFAPFLRGQRDTTRVQDVDCRTAGFGHGGSTASRNSHSDLRARPRLADRQPLLDDYGLDGMIEYVQYVLDTALSPDHSQDDIGPGAMLVGWETGRSRWSWQ